MEKRRKDVLCKAIKDKYDSNISMKIFLSYGHDSNAPLIEKIKDYLSKDVEEKLQMKLGQAGVS